MKLLGMPLEIRVAGFDITENSVAVERTPGLQKEG